MALQDILNQLGTAPITTDSLSQPSALSFIGDAVGRAASTAVPVAPVTTPPGAQFSAIYAFGDSSTDAGNVSLATTGLLPVSPPYGRVFSDGPVWIQDVAQILGYPAIQPSLAGGTDFAYGGAHTGQTPGHTLNPTDFTAQVGQFNTQVATPQANALYAIWIGSNDVFEIANNTSLTHDQQQAAVGAAVQNEVAGISALAARGAKDFLVLNVPDLGKTPNEIARPATQQTATNLSALYDAELAQAVDGLRASGALKIDLVDTFGLLNLATANPAAAGFTDVTTPEWTGNLTDSHSGTLNTAGSHLYFDNIHPTAQAHALLADNIVPTLPMA
jgi:phospholipase/lecithinase/hemolysin